MVSLVVLSSSGSSCIDVGSSLSLDVSIGMLLGLSHLSIVMVVVLQDWLSFVMFDPLGMFILINFKLEKFSLQSGVDLSLKTLVSSILLSDLVVLSAVPLHYQPTWCPLN